METQINRKHGDEHMLKEDITTNIHDAPVATKAINGYIGSGRAMEDANEASKYDRTVGEATKQKGEATNNPKAALIPLDRMHLPILTMNGNYQNAP